MFRMLAFFPGLTVISAIFAVLGVLALPVQAAESETEPAAPFESLCRDAGGDRGKRVVCADLVALDQMLVYNRFGSFNPFGMIFALRRDVVPMSLSDMANRPDCSQDTGTHAASTEALDPGSVRLRDCRRPRPVVLRANVGDLLYLRVTNLLAPGEPDANDPAPRDFSRDFCKTGPSDDPDRAAVAEQVSRGDDTLVEHGEATCEPPENSPEGDLKAQFEAPDWPRTRALNMVIQGLMPLAEPGKDAPHPACFGLDAVAPGDDFSCLYEVVQEGTHFMSSRAAPSGGEGDGGTITHGLFGAVMAERPGTRWYRSQVSQAALDEVWPPLQGAARHARQGGLDYEKKIGDMPVLNLARAVDGQEFRDSKALELVHSDLNAIIWCDPEAPGAKPEMGESEEEAMTPLGCATDVATPVEAPGETPPADQSATASEDTEQAEPTIEPRYNAFREFSVFFHDELKTFYTRNFEELGRFGQFSGVRDGFAINYGASGMGTMLLANRKGIGPAAACMECLYEEFFLTSWANGDPALLEWYADDPSNVHHSYLNDPVVFRNFHAGPKETHVFHLHAHQWFAGNDPSRGSYLDSQTVAPGQGFTYNIYHGGRKNGQGGAYVAGSGNRNRTVGDSIFHCHLYPHFAQGMWALWRVHDVFEDGTRKLPDGQVKPGLSADIRKPDEAHFKRTGSVDPETGAWLDSDDPATGDAIEGAGTPIPALVPLPGEALPPLPSYNAQPAAAAQPDAASEVTQDEASLPGAVTPPPRRDAASLPRRGAAVGAIRRDQPAWSGPERIIRTQASSTPAAPAEADGADMAGETANAPAADAPADSAPQTASSDNGTTQPVDAMPGYPFYIAGEAGHRPPQAPMDIARKLDGAGMPTDEYLSGGLGRHTVSKAERKLDFISTELEDRDAALANDLDNDHSRRELETLRSQAVAKALALGDMTAHLENADIRALDPDGTALERAAQAFHNDGAGLTILGPDGSPAPALNGSYATLTAPIPGETDMAPGRYHVNGSPAAPGAPFADPCGGAPERDGPNTANDPFTNRAAYVIDPNLLGFRRYEVSAVQVDLVVNQAGWHDPQARIDVLTDGSDTYKDLGDESRKRISPTIRDDSEPFFFRAISGECIEFRHTNELPKDLEMDDFQVKTPTDTIGQHIHLVKFDVTSSDGSGNGWNYEDGTFAADELMARRCANLGADLPLPDRPEWGFTAANAALCTAVADKSNRLSRIWREPMGKSRDGTPYTIEYDGMDAPIETRDLFQTTVQRWFADPILTQASGKDPADRTMRTVFSHDHFGPSSIQQHGFYTALLIEPGSSRVCDPANLESCTEQVTASAPFQVANADADWVGSHKVILGEKANDPFHPDYREFALAVADFALLYDPRDREDIASLDPNTAGERAGMSRLNCEAQLAAQDRGAEIIDQCGEPNPAEPEADVAPAWWAAGAPGDLQSHQDRLHGNLIAQEDADKLREHLISYRSRAASPDGQPVEGPTLAQPVAPPARPESISVDHHDPYMVNYRNAPLPLRLATKNADGSPSNDCAPLGMTLAGTRSAEFIPGGPVDSNSEVVETLKAGQMPRCSYRYQLAGDLGDAAHALRSWAPGNDAFPAREPETPRFEAYQDERLMFRLIQGAQEVQHSFNLAGLAGPRNIDQRFSQGMRNLAYSVAPARRACFEAVRRTRPELYDEWLDHTPAREDAMNQSNPVVAAKIEYFKEMDAILANCDNIDGYTFAQEIGISEHFELRSRMRADIGTIEALPSASSPEGGQAVTEASDYLYNFGTVDALWNGAWGLLRVYAQEQGRDDLISKWQLASGSQNNPAPPLKSIADIRKAIEQGSPTTAEASEDQGAGASAEEMLAAVPGCPLPTDLRAGRNNTAALLVALRTDMLFPRGTDYGGHRYDPDGLMLALLNPDSVRFEGTNDRRDMRNNDHWRKFKTSDGTEVDNRPRLQTVLDAVKAAYPDGPEPFVMRVNAGDCVSLRYINTLTEDAPGAGLPDGLGDALMPPIAPLNTDPQVSVERITDASGTRVVGSLSPTTAPITGLRPSARLGLSIGLPGGDLIRTLPLGYGINAPAMEPASNDRAVVSQELRFYAGRMRIAATLPGQTSNDPLLQIASDALGKLKENDLLGDPEAAFGLNDNLGPDEKPDFTLLGRAYKVTGMEVTDEQRLDIQTMVSAELQRYIHWIPYAFGPVPVRVTGDMISQTTHGMFGTIDVLPRDWTIPESLAPVMETPQSDTDLVLQLANLDEELGEDSPLAGFDGSDEQVTIATKWRSAAVAQGFGAGALYEDASLAPDPEKPGAPAARVREFVIFYQDGLNQLDEKSKIIWSLTGEDGPDAVAQAAARSTSLPQMTPDCKVCDDSYDLGEQGVSYRSRPFASLLRYADIAGVGRIEASDDLNAITFPNRFFAGQWANENGNNQALPDTRPLTMMACPGDQVLIRVIHPGGRARQRAFAMNGMGYDDLFPGFGFPNAALVAPMKSVSAWLHPPQTLGQNGEREPAEGTVLWHDGVNFLMAGGTWGLVSFSYDAPDCDAPGAAGQ